MAYSRTRTWNEIARDIPADHVPSVDWSKRQAKCDLLRQRQLEYKAWLKRHYGNGPVDDDDIIVLDYYFVLSDELSHERELLANHRVAEYEITTHHYLEKRAK